MRNYSIWEQIAQLSFNQTKIQLAKMTHDFVGIFLLIVQEPKKTIVKKHIF